jgi:hypothetical protein
MALTKYYLPIERSELYFGICFDKSCGSNKLGLMKAVLAKKVVEVDNVGKLIKVNVTNEVDKVDEVDVADKVDQ